MERVRTRLRALAEPLSDVSVRRLWYARTVSEAGNWAARIALTLHVFAVTGSPLTAAAVTTVSLLPHLGIGQLLGTLADRYPHRTVMVVSDVVRGLLFLLLAVTDLPVGAVLGVAFLAGLADPPFTAAYSAALPQLAGDRYLAAQTLFTGTRQAMTLVGFAAGGVVVAAVGTAPALGLNGLSFLVGVLFIAGIRSTRSRDAADREPLIRPAVRALVSDRLIVVSVAVVTMGTLLGITVESLMVAYAAHLGVGPTGAGLLATVPPLAAFATTFFLPTEGEHARLVRLVCRTVSVMAVVSFAVFAVDSPLPVVLVGFLAAGALDVMTVPAGVVIAQRLPQASRGTAFSFLEGLLMVSHAAGALAAGALAAGTSVSTAAAVLTVPAAATAGLGLLALARARGPRSVGLEAPALPGVPVPVGVPD
ncbi:MAG TPA: MFS transporter [Blastococcus sp.]|nr:MFS transporter [Blastococcus sp.]